MTWFKVDDGLHSHPKWLAATGAARALWTTAGSWCASHLTDGRVPRHVLPLLGARPRDAAELVRVGLWETNGDGWLFHDWHLYQPTAEAVEAEREAARERQRRARDKARESRRDSDRESPASNGVSHGPPDPTRPDPSTSMGATTPTTAPGQPPPTRCPTHQTWPPDQDIPDCRACGDARRAHDAWRPSHPLAGQQQAQRTAAEEHMQAVHELVAEQPDPARNVDAIAHIRSQHHLATGPEDAA